MPVKKVTSSKKQVTKNKNMKVSKETSRLAVARSKNIVRARSRTSSLSVPVYSLTGRASGILSLPKEIFGQKVNKNLLAQAVRVYMANQKIHTASTKTRGEVQGSTAKIYRQKGTGRARHGAIRAPIFVGGGITFGPKPRKVKLNLPQKMKRSALISAFSSKMGDKEILGISGMEKATGKTKEMAKLLEKVGTRDALIVTGEKIDNVVRAVRNIPKVDVLPVNLINAYEVLKHDMLLITKDAADALSGKGKAERVK